MDNYLNNRNEKRKKRALRVRKHIRGCAERPRLAVHKTNKHLSVQLIDDEQGITIASLGTLSTSLRKSDFTKKSKESAKHLGAKIAELAKEKQVEKVVFDRGRFKYHGIIAELADAAREAGLQF